jgi:hypothetical protein
LSLVEALQRLLNLALSKVRAAGVIAEDAVLAIVDAVMGFAVDMLQTGKRLAHVTNLITASWSKQARNLSWHVNFPWVTPRLCRGFTTV